MGYLEEKVQLGQGQVAMWLPGHTRGYNRLQDQHLLLQHRLLCGMRSRTVDMYCSPQGICMDVSVYMSDALLSTQLDLLFNPLKKSGSSASDTGRNMMLPVTASVKQRSIKK